MPVLPKHLDYKFMQIKRWLRGNKPLSFGNGVGWGLSGYFQKTFSVIFE